MAALLHRGRMLAAAIALVGLGAATGHAELPAPATLVARAAPELATEFDVYFPPQHVAALKALTAEQVDPGSPQYHQWLTPQQFERRFGAAPADVAAVTAALHGSGFTVTGRSALALHLRGTVAAVEHTFGAEISQARLADGRTTLVAPRPLVLPAALVAAGAHVPQFANTAPHRPHSTMLANTVGDAERLNATSAAGPYFPADLRQAYDFPSALKLTGAGMTIGVLASGDFNAADLKQFWTDSQISKIAPKLVPKVTTVQIAGGAPYSPTASAETELDIEQAAGVSLGANVVLYNIPNLTDPMILAGLTAIVEANTADVVTMSFGAPETNYPATGTAWVLQLEHMLFLQGNTAGITFVASTGDNGADPNAQHCVSGTCTTQTVVTPETPATDPNVTAVGGTNLLTPFAKTGNSAYVSENANFDLLSVGNGKRWGSGGGISTVFAKPSYQTRVKTPSSTFRTIPDLSFHMGGCQTGFTGFGKCPGDRSSDWEAIGGKETKVIGTSAAAAGITGLLLLKAKLSKTHRLGNANPAIYALAELQGLKKLSAFKHIKIAGSNGPYATNPKIPYDMVIGNGTVIGRSVLSATNLPTAGIPGTTANP